MNQNLVPEQGTTSTCSSAAAVDSWEMLLQVIPAKVTKKRASQIPTYSLVDSGSDIDMIDHSLAKSMNMEGISQ